MELRENQELALKKMLFALGDRAAGSSGFYEDDPVFENIHRATWAGLAKKEYVRIVDFVGGRPVCFLTGRGWRRALAISGMSESPEFIGRVAKLAKNLSVRVQDREAPAQVPLHQLAAEVGVPEGFIWNVVESGAMTEVMGGELPYWHMHADNSYVIEVPAGFGKEP